MQLQPDTFTVRVVWDKINVPGISNYTVYYSTEGESEQFRSVHSSENSVMIMDLRSDVEYEFQVVAIGIVNRQEISGERSTITNQSVILLPAMMTYGERNAAIVISIFVFISVLFLLMMVWSIVYNRRRSGEIS